VNRSPLPWPPEPVRLLVSKAVVGLMRLEDRLSDPRV
jgi:hypothetical protein